MRPPAQASNWHWLMTGYHTIFGQYQWMAGPETSDRVCWWRCKAEHNNRHEMDLIYAAYCYCYCRCWYCYLLLHIKYYIYITIINASIKQPITEGVVEQKQNRNPTEHRIKPFVMAVNILHIIYLFLFHYFNMPPYQWNSLAQRQHLVIIPWSVYAKLIWQSALLLPRSVLIKPKVGLH